MDRDLPRISFLSPVLWWRYFVRVLASVVPPSPVKGFLYRLTGIDVGRRVFIGHGVYFVDGFKAGLIELREEAVLSPRAIVIAMAVPGDSFLGREYEVTKTAKIVIGEGAWIGAGAVLLPGVTIGRGAIVGANAVVNRRIPPLEVWGGVPARHIRRVEEYGRRVVNVEPTSEIVGLRFGFGVLLRRLSLLVTVMLLLGWLFLAARDPLHMPEKPSRLSTLNQIVTQANQGNFGQLTPGVAMETEWEDPGMGITVSLLGTLKQRLGLGRSQLEDVYRVQFMVVALVFLLPFVPGLLSLPNWFYPVIPLFMLIAIEKGFLFFSWNQYWASTLATFWVGMSIVHILEVFKSPTSGAPRWVSAAVVGVGIGVLGLFRRSTLTEGLLALGLVVLALLFNARRSIPGGIKRFLATRVLVAGIFIVAVLAPTLATRVLWMVRDHSFVMQDVPRNPQHPLWAPIYLGLGYVPNRFGISWDDAVGLQHVSREFPGIRYASVDYEHALRTLFFRVVREEPSLLSRNIVAKAIALSNEIGIPIAVAAYLLYITAVFLPQSRYYALAASLWLSLSLATPLLCFPQFFFYLSFHSGLYFWSTVVAAFAVSRLIPGLTAGGRARSALTRWRIALALAPFAVAAALGLTLYGVYAAGVAPPQRFLPITAELRWTVADAPDFTDGRRVRFSAVPDGASHEYRIGLPTADARITAIRLDPSESETIDVVPESVALLDRTGRVTREFGFRTRTEVGRDWTLYQMLLTEADGRIRLSPRGADPFFYARFEPIEVTQVVVKMRLVSRYTFQQWLDRAG